MVRFWPWLWSRRLWSVSIHGMPSIPPWIGGRAIDGRAVGERGIGERGIEEAGFPPLSGSQG